MNLHSEIKKQLTQALESGKVSHTLLFSGKCGYGTMPLALWYAEQLLCKNNVGNCSQRVKNLQHPDLNFCFPIATMAGKSKNGEDFLPEWRNFLKEQVFGGLYDWMQFLEVEKKQGSIVVEQAKEIIHKLNLRSFEGGYKVMLIWLPETMNISVANKLLKILEEPPKDTVFMLISEKPEELLPTIISRCQIIQIPRLEVSDIENILTKQYSTSEEEASRIALACEGDMGKALSLIEYKTEEFESLFVDWVRNAFMAKKKLTVLEAIYDWAMTISSWSRERQKQFLAYCTEVFRQALLTNYGADDLALSKIKSNNFKWNIFSKFIHGANIAAILEELTTASYHVERNGNGKMIFLDLGIKMTRYLHIKES